MRGPSMQSNRSVPRQRGFSLIELMVVVTMVAIMLGIGIPSFKSFTSSQRVKGAAVDFATALLQARSEAIKRNSAVTIAQHASGWTYGWTVTVGATTLATQEALTSMTVGTTPSGTSSVVYSGNGRITAASTLRFQFGSDDTTSVRCVSVSTSGVPSTTTSSCT